MTTIVIYDKRTREVTEIIELEENEKCRVFRGVEPVFADLGSEEVYLIENAYLINPWEE